MKCRANQKCFHIRGSVHFHSCLLARPSFFLTLNESSFETKRKGGREEEKGRERGKEGRERGREGKERGEGERKRGEEERGGREGREREREGRERGYGNSRDAAHTCSLAPVGGVPGMYPTLSEEERVWQMSEDN